MEKKKQGIKSGNLMRLQRDKDVSRSVSSVALRRGESGARLKELASWNNTSSFNLEVSSRAFHVEGGLSAKCLIWSSAESPPQKHVFSDWLSFKDGILHMGKLSLDHPDLLEELYVGDSSCWVYNTELISRALRTFEAKYLRECGRIGVPDEGTKLEIAYAMKANSFRSVLEKIVDMRCGIEICTEAEVDMISSLVNRKVLDADNDTRRIIINGIKMTKRFSVKCLELCEKWKNHVLMIDSAVELQHIVENARMEVKVGLRLKCRNQPQSIAEMDKLVSRFGLDSREAFEYADAVARSKHLRFVGIHAMGGCCSDIKGFVGRGAVEMYAKLRQKIETLEFLDIGGGMPGGVSGLGFDYERCISVSINMIQEVCRTFAVPTPMIIAEFGSYLTSSHGCHLFRVIGVKNEGSAIPWYILNGSIMNSLPDIWALGDHFCVLPVDVRRGGACRQVMLGGMTCDEDDVYPPPGSDAKLYLPVDYEDLIVAFCSVGSYEQMLSGTGVHHCSVKGSSHFVYDKPRGLRKLKKSDYSIGVEHLGYAKP